MPFRFLAYNNKEKRVNEKKKNTHTQLKMT